MTVENLALAGVTVWAYRDGRRNRDSRSRWEGIEKGTRRTHDASRMGTVLYGVQATSTRYQGSGARAGISYSRPAYTYVHGSEHHLGSDIPRCLFYVEYRMPPEDRRTEKRLTKPPPARKQPRPAPP
jgi:hypothetical protein